MKPQTRKDLEAAKELVADILESLSFQIDDVKIVDMGGHPYIGISCRLDQSKETAPIIDRAAAMRDALKGWL